MNTRTEQLARRAQAAADAADRAKLREQRRLAALQRAAKSAQSSKGRPSKGRTGGRLSHDPEVAALERIFGITLAGRPLGAHGKRGEKVKRSDLHRLAEVRTGDSINRLRSFLPDANSDRAERPRTRSFSDLPPGLQAQRVREWVERLTDYDRRLEIDPSKWAASVGNPERTKAVEKELLLAENRAYWDARDGGEPYPIAEARFIVLEDDGPRPAGNPESWADRLEREDELTFQRYGYRPQRKQPTPLTAEREAAANDKIAMHDHYNRGMACKPHLCGWSGHPATT